MGISKGNLYDDAFKRERLLSYLGLGTYARKLQIVNLTPAQYKKFAVDHHLQGYATASVKLGLIDKSGNIKAMMSFSPSRYANTQWELIRYCSDGTVVGGASKLFSHFIAQYSPDTVVSYANRNWSQGNLYRALGFTDTTTDVKNTSTWYFKRYTRYHRSSLTKKRLVDMGFDPTKTADQILDEEGFLKVFDYGNWRFTWQRSS